MVTLMLQTAKVTPRQTSSMTLAPARGGFRSPRHVRSPTRLQLQQAYQQVSGTLTLGERTVAGEGRLAGATLRLDYARPDRTQRQPSPSPPTAGAPPASRSIRRPPAACGVSAAEAPTMDARADNPSRLLHTTGAVAIVVGAGIFKTLAMRHSFGVSRREHTTAGEG